MAELNELCPSVDWATFFTMLFQGTGTQLREPIIVQVPSYLGKLDGILPNTEDSTLSDYLIWHALQGYISSLDDTMINVNQDFEEV
jgi:predicted metalloendopeptidase